MPVIQTGAFELSVRNFKAERPNQMQCAAGDGTGTRNIAGILWDLRLYQNNAKHIHSPSV